MGNVKDDYGKPVFDDTYDFPQDSQDGADFTNEFANVRRGPVADRQSLPAGKRRDGMLWVESDTGAIYEWRDATGWKVVHIPDTGWKPIGALVSGWTVQAGDTIDYRVMGGALYMRGRLNATGAAAQLNVLAVPLPAEARPAQDRPMLVGVTGGSGQSCVVSVGANGQLNVYKGGSSVLNLPLEGIGATPLG